MTELIQHHVKYKEIHGVDEIKMLTWSEHQKLHAQLRREGKCNIPVESLTKISQKAHKRTINYKQWEKIYNQGDVKKECCRRYTKLNTKSVTFYQSMVPKIRLHEIISYNMKTGIPCVSSNFVGTNGYKIHVLEEYLLRLKGIV